MNVIRRCSRYGSSTASRVTDAPTATITTPKYRSGSPSIHSNPSRISTKQTVVPRSGSSMTSPQTSTNAGTSGIRTWRTRLSVRRCCLRASRSAPQSRIASFASSDGWTCSGPKSTQRRDRDDQQRVGHQPEPAGVRSHREPEDRQPDDDELDLADELRPDRRVLVVRGGDRGGRSHQHAEGEQPPAGEEQQLRGRVRPVQVVTDRAGGCSPAPEPLRRL